MPVTLTPYLHFRGNTREAMEFYHSVFGGKLNLQTFKDAHASQDPSDDDLVMHSQLDGDNGLVFMASDPPSRMEDEPGNNCSLSLTGTDEAALRGYADTVGCAVPSAGSLAPFSRARLLEAAVWTLYMAHLYPARYRDGARELLAAAMAS